MMETDRTSCLQVLGWIFTSAFKTGSDVANGGLISCILLTEIVICFIAFAVFVQFDNPAQMGSTIEVLRYILLCLLIIGTIIAIIKCRVLLKQFPLAEKIHNEYFVLQTGIIVFFCGMASLNDILDIYFDLYCIQEQIPFFETLKPDVAYNFFLILFNIIQMVAMIYVLQRKVVIERTILINYGIMFIIWANASVFLCSIINQQTKFPDLSTQSNGSNEISNNISCYSRNDTLFTAKVMINPFDILFSFLAIAFLISKSIPPADRHDEEQQNLLPENNYDGNTSNSRLVQNSQTNVYEISKYNRLVGYILTWSSFFVAVILILYLVLLLCRAQFRIFFYLKKFIHAPILFIFELLAFSSLKHKYFCFSKPLTTFEKLLLVISPFIFLYEISKLSAGIFCNFNTTSTTILSETKISGEIVEALFFIFDHFLQTNLIIQANRSEIKFGKEYISFSVCCVVLFLLNIACIVVDILGVFRLQTLIQDICFGKSLQIFITNITAPPIIFYRLISAGYFLVLFYRYKEKENESLRRSSVISYFFC